MLSSLVSPKGRLGLSEPSWHAECRYAGSSRLQRGQHPSLCIASLWVVEGLAAGLQLKHTCLVLFVFFTSPCCSSEQTFPLLTSGLGVRQCKDQPNLIVIK